MIELYNSQITKGELVVLTPDYSIRGGINQSLVSALQSYLLIHGKPQPKARALAINKTVVWE